MKERLAFVRSHPAPGAVVERADFVLGSLCRPDAVIDWRPSFLAAVVDTCKNVEDEAELEVLGCAGAGEGMLCEAIARAIAIVREGPRRRLAIWEPGIFSPSLLTSLGFAIAYRGYEMERAPAPLPPALEPPAGMRWIDADRRWAEALHETLLQAFADVPGSLVAPLDVLAARLETQEMPMRILVEGARVAAYVRPEKRGGNGCIGSLGRAPWARGMGLGAVALREGMRALAARGLDRIVLEVTARNEDALRLYRAEGFVVRSRTATWSIAVR